MDATTVNILGIVGYSISAIAIVQTLGRFYIRWRSSALYWDDLFTGLALVCFIPCAAIPLPKDLLDSYFYELTLTTYMLNWTTLWLIKASFLALCWNVFSVSPDFRKAWWAVAIYTFSSFWPPFLPTLWQCGDPLRYNDPVACQDYVASEQFTTTSKTVWGFNLALHLSSELLILGLPLWFISKLQMSRAQKIGAASFFCAVIVTIMLGFLRNLASLMSSFYGGLNVNWRWVADIGLVFELPVAVFICALPPYKILLSKIFKRKKPSPALQQNAEQVEQAAPRGKKFKPAAQAVDSIIELERGYVV